MSGRTTELQLTGYHIWAYNLSVIINFTKDHRTLYNILLKNSVFMEFQQIDDIYGLILQSFSG